MQNKIQSNTNWIHSSLTTARFEMQRAFSSKRLVIAVVMALFPPSMLYIIGYTTGGDGAPEFVMAGTLGLVAWLALILWSTTNVHAELEGRGWLYLTSRTSGRYAMLIGKLATSIAWAFAICQVSLCLCLVVCHLQTPLREPFTIWWSFTLLLGLACIGYGSSLSLIGTLFQKRAMLIGVGYLLVGELLLPMLPAVVNKITFRFHLQGLCLSWAGWILPRGGLGGETAAFNWYYSTWGQHSDWFHLAMLLGLSAFCLGFAAYKIRTSEYVTADET